MARPTLFTIGYEGASVDRFVTTLQDAGVASIADVRAVALSRKRGYSKNVLRDNLAQGGLGYRHFVKLGTPKSGREAARAGDSELMRHIYCNEVLNTGEAQQAMEELSDMATREPVCLLCFERDPSHCHRRILAERLRDRGWDVIDLMVI
jgi:uncharacterized protein (DUF488 family)